MSTACHYPTDISAEPWDILKLLLPNLTWRPSGPGRKPLELRRVFHGIFDTISFVVVTMLLNNMACLSFDRDFKQLGLTVIS
jgi:hypothetical protein